MNYTGMYGWIDLGDRMGRNVLLELGRRPFDSCSVCLNTCEIFWWVGNDTTRSEKMSPLKLIPILCRTSARRKRYGVRYSK